MNLLEIREQFRNLSGRYDLVDATGIDNGANTHINAACRWLDRITTLQKSYASSFKFIDPGSFYTTFPLCRAVKSVWAATATNRWRLNKLSLRDMISTYLTGTITSRSSSLPNSYAPAITRYIPEDSTISTLEAFLDFIDVPTITDYNSNAVIINAPTSEKIMLDIKGLFYSIKLIADADTNFWTVVHPEILIKAVLREVEIFNQNPTKVRLWNSVISSDINELTNDYTEELIAGVNQIED